MRVAAVLVVVLVPVVMVTVAAMVIAQSPEHSQRKQYYENAR
jgi:hypothetical protein